MITLFLPAQYDILWLAAAAVVVITPMAEVVSAPEDAAGRSKAIARFFLLRILLLAAALAVGLIVLAMARAGLFGG